MIDARNGWWYRVDIPVRVAGSLLLVRSGGKESLGEDNVTQFWRIVARTTPYGEGLRARAPHCGQIDPYTIVVAEAFPREESTYEPSDRV